MTDTSMTLILNDVIERARRFLEKSQWPGGFWIDFELAVGMSSQWVTAYVAHSLAQAGGSPQALTQARDWLIRTQFDDGGWGFNRHVPPDADSIANVLLFFSGFDRETLEKTSLEKIADFLNTFRSISDGGFKTYRSRPPRPGEEQAEFLYEESGWCISHLSVTALAAEALIRVSKTNYKAIIQAAADFMRAQQSGQGYWNCYWWHGPLYCTYRATRTLSMLGDQAPLQRAAKWLADTCQPDGGWGDNLGGNSAPFFTALAASTLMLITGNPNVQQLIQRGVSWLLDTQRTDGSWESVPMLLTPIPQVRVPWEETDPSCFAAVPDQNRLFTTATVLSALVAYREAIGL